MCVHVVQKLAGEIDPMSATILLSKSKSNYPDIVQRMVRRYLFKQDRLRTDKLDSGQYCPIDCLKVRWQRNLSHRLMLCERLFGG